jgi:conjugal transfer pilus assembly protein TraU
MSPPRPSAFPIGGVKINPGLSIGNGYVKARKLSAGIGEHTANYQVHYYVFPLFYLLELLNDFLCFEQASFDVAYMSEVDATWQDDSIAAVVYPETAVFAFPLAQVACVADCIAATAHLPLDALFWCSGCNGSMYPMVGNIGESVTTEQSMRLAAERMIYKMHRTGLAWGTMGSEGLCQKYLMPILKKQQYRLQMINPTPMVTGSGSCSAIGSSTALPSAGKTFPVTGEDVGYLVWRKRNCCVLWGAGHAQEDPGCGRAATLTAVTGVAAQQIPGIDAEAIERQAQKGRRGAVGFRAGRARAHCRSGWRRKERSSQQAPRPWPMRRTRCARGTIQGVDLDQIIGAARNQARGDENCASAGVHRLCQHRDARGLEAHDC